MEILEAIEEKTRQSFFGLFVLPFLVLPFLGVIWTVAMIVYAPIWIIKQLSWEICRVCK
jgi:hypothetical protein